jgi:zinc and cadmium transporter
MFEWWSIAAAAVVSIVSLTGAFVLWCQPATLQRAVPLLVSLAVGVLLGDAFLHLIPDATEKLGSLSTTCLFVLVGLLLFFVIEKVVRWRHQHTIPDINQNDRHAVNIKPMAKMNLIGDAVHNFTDGVLIAGSFVADPWLGLTTTLAIVVHEIPQEIGDVGALIHGGYAPRRAIFLNFLCSLTVIAGVIATLIVGHWAHWLLPYLLPIAAGGFIYIAVADFIPSLHEENSARIGSLQVVAAVAGVFCMIGVTAVEDAIPTHIAAPRTVASHELQ